MLVTYRQTDETLGLNTLGNSFDFEKMVCMWQNFVFPTCHTVWLKSRSLDVWNVDRGCRKFLIRDNFSKFQNRICKWDTPLAFKKFRTIKKKMMMYFSNLVFHHDNVPTHPTKFCNHHITILDWNHSSNLLLVQTLFPYFALFSHIKIKWRRKGDSFSVIMTF